MFKKLQSLNKDFLAEKNNDTQIKIWNKGVSMKRQYKEINYQFEKYLDQYFNLMKCYTYYVRDYKFGLSL